MLMENELPNHIIIMMERSGVLPRTHDEDGIEDIDRIVPNIFELNTPEWDAYWEPNVR
tara:strand:+ start:266 stop:439 length:174 start_codon:yes stop_codon:yes gene_type:complete